MIGVETGLETDAGTYTVTGSWTEADTNVGTGSVGIGLIVIGCDGMEEGVLVVSDTGKKKKKRCRRLCRIWCSGVRR